MHFCAACRFQTPPCLLPYPPSQGLKYHSFQCKRAVFLNPKPCQAVLTQGFPCRCAPPVGKDVPPRLPLPASQAAVPHRAGECSVVRRVRIFPAKTAQSASDFPAVRPDKSRGESPPAPCSIVKAVPPAWRRVQIPPQWRNPPCPKACRHGTSAHLPRRCSRFVPQQIHRSREWFHQLPVGFPRLFE